MISERDMAIGDGTVAMRRIQRVRALAEESSQPFVREIMRLRNLERPTYELTTAGLRLVSVMSSGVTFRQDAKAVQFRSFLDECGHLEHLPEGSFKSSGTMVNTVVVVLTKKQN